MSGKPITDQQIRLYMKQRKQGRTQVVAAAKTGLSERSALRIGHGELVIPPFIIEVKSRGLSHIQ